ncbi:hypothetical protein [Desulfoluna butyratoxydans]|uniref:Uncharacterized protein n=1 Tax=Desulfoluna butyratoxydans TaxID=231438 RepID=A0A4U8YQ67_9BACT|nr:hypothetical protein [Desulfoluna butyratoxydans]VFQ45960.1 hypothetical protein MSL71_36230 [Desulfoluna butyratoxydans]
MAWCTQEDLTLYVLQAYLSVAEEKSPGIMNRAVDAVNGEIDEALLAGGYAASGASATLCRIAAALSAWRTVAAVTTLVTSEADTDNEWLPLLHERNRAESDLAAIREGKLDPFPKAQSS